MTYNEIIQKAGKRIKKHVYYIKNNTTTYVNDDNIERIKINTQTPLLGTSITGCEITLKEKIDGAIYVQIDATYNNETKNKTYGPFTLKQEPTYDANKKTYLHSTYNALLKTMVDYQAITINYPCTIFQFFSQLITELGYTTSISSLDNGTIQIQSDPYDGIGFTYRDVLDDIAYATGSCFYVDINDIKNAFSNHGGMPISINDDVLKNQNINFGEHYGPINSIVLTRSSDTDSVYLQDAQSIAQNGLCEFKIRDNQLMNGNNRSDFLPALLNKLKGISYDIYDVEVTGYGATTPQRDISFTTNNKSYFSHVFNEEITLTSGYKQALYTDVPEQTASDYTYMTETDKTEWETGILIDKKVGDVDIRGKTINLTSDSIAINSTNFSVDTSGNMTCNNATINGTIQKTFGSTTIALGNPNNTGNALEISYTDNSFKSYVNAGNFITYHNNIMATLMGYGHTLLVNDTNGNQIFKSDGYTDKTEIKKLVAGNIDCGNCVLNSSAADVTVYFNKTFASAPKVVITPNTTVSGVIAPKVKSITTTYFTATIGGNIGQFSNVNCSWIAIE